MFKPITQSEADKIAQMIYSALERADLQVSPNKSAIKSIDMIAITGTLRKDDEPKLDPLRDLLEPNSKLPTQVTYKIFPTLDKTPEGFSYTTFRDSILAPDPKYFDPSQKLGKAVKSVFQELVECCYIRFKTWQPNAELRLKEK